MMKIFKRYNNGLKDQGELKLLGKKENMVDDIANNIEY